MDNKIEERPKGWVKKNYNQNTTVWTYERSEGNFADCFYDGYNCATR